MSLIKTTMKKSVFQTAKELCRELRKRSTRSELIFWTEVRNRKILGKKFLRQYPIFLEYLNRKRFFIADFYCHEGRLVIEIDGKNHDYQKEYDELRSYIINNLGIEVIRFRKGDIENDIERILVRLKAILGERTHTLSLS
jgi:very-short-patch-repair endonuclease